MKLRNLHHQVRNNLQGITGLLGLQAVRRPEAAPALRSAIRQIQAMAIVHGLQALHGAGIRLQALIHEMVEALRRSERADIRFEVVSPREDWMLPAREAVPVAMIASELLWNALQHRDRGRRDAVFVRLARGDGAGAILCVRNPGRLPRGAGRPSAAAGGLELMHSLLPPGAGALALRSKAGWVEAELRLAPPAARRIRSRRRGALPRAR